MNTVKNMTAGLVAGCLLALPMAAVAQSPKEIETMQSFLNIMHSYFKIIESTYAVSSDTEKAAIMQMQKIQEIYEKRGEKVRSVAILEKVLKDSDNITIRNAAYILLSDTLKESGRADEAIELLRQGLAENIRNSGS